MAQAGVAAPGGMAAINERVRESSGAIQRILQEIGKVVIGQRVLIERLVVGLLANGHEGFSTHDPTGNPPAGSPD